MDAIVQAIVSLIENVSNFIWGGTWNGVTIVPFGPLAVILLGVGLMMMFRLGFRPLRRFVPALVEVWQGRKAQGTDGAITPWQALSTALAGQVGTGNLAGVATAIALGGPGAIFWMWVTAIFGMALAFSESSLAVKYRETDEYGRINGGPMYYIKNGLGKNWGWLAIIFCIGTLFSAMATGSMIQANSITQTAVETAQNSFGIALPNWAVGVVLAGLVFAVIIGGIKSIGSFAGKVVPFMALLYVIAAFIVLVMNISEVPHAFYTIIASAFGFEEAFGGLAGYAVLAAVRAGVARGLFSNEAGQGSAPIAHAAARTGSPVMQGEIAMIGVFIDTIIICTMTALVILTVSGDFKISPAHKVAAYCQDAGVELPANPAGAAFTVDTLFPTAYTTGREGMIATNGPLAADYIQSCRAAGVDLAPMLADKTPEGTAAYFELALAGAVDASALADVRYVWQTDAEASGITARAYGHAFPHGEWIVTIALFFFAFTTIIGWSYYGEQAVTYLIGEWATHPFRYLWVIVVFCGVLVPPSTLWLLGDIANASMALPNLLALVLLSGTVVAMHKAQSGSVPSHAKPEADAAPGE